MRIGIDCRCAGWHRTGERGSRLHAARPCFPPHVGGARREEQQCQDAQDQWQLVVLALLGLEDGARVGARVGLAVRAGSGASGRAKRGFRRSGGSLLLCIRLSRNRFEAETGVALRLLALRFL